jgi:hypothetical protein
MVPVENPTQLLDEIRLGLMVNVKVGNETLSFSTNGCSAALVTVTNCMRRHAQQAQSPG